MVRLLAALVSLVLLAAACGDDDSEDTASDRTASPSATPAKFTERTNQYMQLAEARRLLEDLGLEGVSLSPRNYECIQMECPDEAPGDESWGCLSLLPTGNPKNAESLLPDDPPGWYSVFWHGAFSETYAAPPEPVVSEPTTRLEAGQDMVCGADFERFTTAGEAAAFLADLGLEGDWVRQNEGAPTPTCPPGEVCPIESITKDTPGCLGIAVYNVPTGGDNAMPKLYVNWRSEGGPDYPDGIFLNYSLLRPLKAVEDAIQPIADEECVTSGPRLLSSPYDSIPFTDILWRTEWRLTRPPVGRTLELIVAVGGGCDEFERIDVSETGDSVTIQAFSRHSTPGPYHACTLELNHETTTMELGESLGNRRLEGCDPLPDIHFFDEVPDCTHPH